MRLRMHGATDVGLVRQSNQDAYFCSAEWGVVIVSDGMGGHKGGEIASALVVEGLRDGYLATSQILVENVGPFLDDVLKRINLEILRRSKEDEKLRGMGATVNYLQFAGGYVSIGHAGDSRTYLVKSWRNGEKREVGMWCLTIDHNVETFLYRGLLVPGRDYPKGPVSEQQKARLTRGMGVVSDLKADLYLHRLAEGDVYLTCSDGLHGFCSQKQIIEALLAGPLAKAPERLIKAAHAQGAPDNVTVVVSAVSDSEEPLLDPPKPPADFGSFLLRLPSGEIRGPMKADDVIAQWTRSEIPADAEVASGTGRWIFLERKQELFDTYPVFDTAVVRSHYDRILPASLVGEESGRGSRSTEASRRFLYVALACTFILLLCVVFFMP